MACPKIPLICIDSTNYMCAYVLFKVSDSFSVVKNKSTVFSKNDSLATRAKKLQAIKESIPERGKRIQIKEVKTLSDDSSNNDVQFVIQVIRCYLFCVKLNYP